MLSAIMERYLKDTVIFVIENSPGFSFRGELVEMWTSSRIGRIIKQVATNLTHLISLTHVEYPDKNVHNLYLGFGDLMGNFYIGNEIIHLVTSTRPHKLRIEVTDVYGDSGYAEYANFRSVNSNHSKILAKLLL